MAKDIGFQKSRRFKICFTSVKEEMGKQIDKSNTGTRNKYCVNNQDQVHLCCKAHTAFMAHIQHIHKGNYQYYQCAGHILF